MTTQQSPSPQQKQPPAATPTRQQLAAQDNSDPLRHTHSRFVPYDGIYLCGNSLGLMPRHATTAVNHILHHEWAPHAVTGWAKHHWRERPQQLGNKLAPHLGAQADQILVTDSTSINLYKVLHQALHLTDNDRNIIITERENFPADIFICQSIAKDYGATLITAPADQLHDAITQAGEQLAVVTLADVNYRTGARHNMTELTHHTHQQGGLMIWDLAHSAGAAPINLTETGADFAIGCGYKFLNGGPGAPAFIWANPRHSQHFTDPNYPTQPLTGWLGHHNPFNFTTIYEPSPGPQHYLCSSPSQLHLAALDAGIDTHTIDPELGGWNALWDKSVQLNQLFRQLLDDKIKAAFTVVTPTDPTTHGSQISLQGNGELQGHEKELIHALSQRGVIGDFRIGEQQDNWSTPGLMRFGIAPLYNTRTDIYDTVDILADIIHTGSWQTATDEGAR